MKIKRMFKIMFGIGIPLGIVCLLIKMFFKIPNDTFTTWYFIFAILAIVMSMVINISVGNNFAKKLRNLTNLLDDGKFDEYIAENEKLLLTKKHKYNIAIININISLGYSYKKDYKKATKILLSISSKDLVGANNGIYYLNLAQNYFMLYDYEEVLNIINTAEKNINAIRSIKLIEDNIAILDIMVSIIKEEYALAQRLLKEVKERHIDPKLNDSIKYLEVLLQEKSTNI